MNTTILAVGDRLLRMPTSAPTNGQVLAYSTSTGGLIWTSSGGGGGSTTFIGLTDVPASFTSQALKVVRVNAGATALEFVAVTGTGSAVFATTPTVTTPIFGSTHSFTPAGYLTQSAATTAGVSQTTIQNLSSGVSASVGYVVNNDASSDTSNFGEFGINSSFYSGTGSYNSTNYVYLNSNSCELAIGTSTANGIHFYVNNGATDAMTISSAGVIAMTGAPTAPTAAVGTNTTQIATTAFVQTQIKAGDTLGKSYMLATTQAVFI